MINRRQFVKRTFGALFGLSIFGRSALRHSAPELVEMTVTLGNRSVFYPLWEWPTIKAGDVKARIEQLHEDNLVTLIDETVASLDNDQGAEVCMDKFNNEMAELEQIAHSLDDGEDVAERLDQFAQAISAQRSERSREPEYFFHRPVKEEMARIIAASPETTRRQAFVQAVMERAEVAL